ncbi:hypothetical protein [Xylella fastidiosa]|uniref:hypothetical protein n=1 Tax=Xylella fastidiosa TaxID=2371 RepID=UPI000A68E635|nr:hypothetical protein [Xylella fastidiosa]
MPDPLQPLYFGNLILQRAQTKCVTLLGPGAEAQLYFLKATHHHVRGLPHPGFWD